MATAARKPARNLSAVPTPRAAPAVKAAAKLDPEVAADAAIGRALREFFSWTLQLVMWVLSGLLTVGVYVTFPEGGLFGALATNVVVGLLLVLLILRWSRG